MTEKYWNIRGMLGDHHIDLLVAAPTRHRAKRAVMDGFTVERVKPQVVITRLASGDRLSIIDDAEGAELASTIDWFAEQGASDGDE